MNEAKEAFRCFEKAESEKDEFQTYIKRMYRFSELHKEKKFLGLVRVIILILISLVIMIYVGYKIRDVVEFFKNKVSSDKVK